VLCVDLLDCRSAGTAIVINCVAFLIFANYARYPQHYWLFYVSRVRLRPFS
jgi:hypothetical protein